jgi:hypothetical protein
MSQPRFALTVALSLLAATFSFFAGVATHGAENGLEVVPARVELNGNFSQVQLQACRTNQGEAPSPSSDDLTSQALFSSSDAQVVQASASGQLVAIGNGDAVVSVTAGGARREVPVVVRGVIAQPKINFSEQIRPILTKSGCAMAACHAAQHGQGGFKLSVFGFEPDKDRTAIAREALQRRLDFVEPERSLLLLKPTMQMPHGGGKRVEKGSLDYQLLLAWLADGAPGPGKNDREVARLVVTPADRITAMGASQQLRAIAEYADGSSRDVTAWAQFDSLDDGVAKVTQRGLVSVIGKGQGAVMVRFEGAADTALFVVPFAPQVALEGWTHQNFIDEHAAAKFRELGLEPSGRCDDATFVRRAFLDAIGTLPSVEETKDFLASTDPLKRMKLVDRLLGLTGDAAQDIYNDSYAAWWSLKWSDLLRNNSADLGEQGMWAMHNWIRESLRSNKPFDKFVQELITARGSIYTTGPANYFRVHKDASMLAEATAQLFLGVRLECAKCHHHPFERYSQEDYFGLAAFFARTGTKTSEEFGLFGREQAVIVKDAGDVRHPRTNKTVEPKALDGTGAGSEFDRRVPLAAWLTSKENPYFARSVVNRYVGYLLGSGLVEPVDDMRSTNPPTNAPLLDALANHFTASNFDLKQLVRVIMTSRLYQLDSQPTAANLSDTKFFSHFAVKRLPAEALIDAIDASTGVRTKYRNLPLGTRAIELPDAEYPDYFLNTFAKPRRVSVCECERAPDPSLAQALHTLNGDVLSIKIKDAKGRVGRLLAEKKSPEEIVEELYLAALSRMPAEGEQAASRELRADSKSPTEFYEDLLWALINSKQFLFVR